MEKKMEHCKVKNMYDLTQTLAAPLLETVDYLWEVLPKIGELIKEIGLKLDPEVFEQCGENICIAIWVFFFKQKTAYELTV